MTEAPPFAPDEPIVVGIFYPQAFWNDAEGWARDVEMIKEVDPRIEVILEEYSESHELRTLRAQKPREELEDLLPKLTEEQRAAFAKIDAVCTLDLPYDVAEVAPKLKWVQGL